MKKLYELEYEVAKLRKEYLDKVQNEELTLKEVLDLGFNKVMLNNCELYKDNENEYLTCGYYLDDENILNKKVVYLDNDLIYYWENDTYYLEIKVDFINEKDKTLLEDFMQKIYDEEKIKK